MARRGGFEPPTPRFVVWCSIQLSYRRRGGATRDCVPPGAADTSVSDPALASGLTPFWRPDPCSAPRGAGRWQIALVVGGRLG